MVSGRADTTQVVATYLDGVHRNQPFGLGRPRAEPRKDLGDGVEDHDMVVVQVVLRERQDALHLVVGTTSPAP